MKHAPCRVPGCTGTTDTRYAIYCSAHRHRSRRHGHPEQRAITKSDLDAYKKVLKRILMLNRRVDWSAVGKRWEAVADHARGVLAEFKAGKAGHRGTRQAAENVIAIAENVALDDILQTVIAMYLALEFDPRLFRDDVSFKAQIVRVIRRLTAASSSFSVNPRTGRMHASARELTPSARRVMAEWLVAVFAPVGVHLAKLERERLTAVDRRRTEYRELLASLRVAPTTLTIEAQAT